MQVSQYQLSELVDTSILQEIQDKFSETTGVAGVIVDRYGRPLTQPSRFTAFCDYVRSTEEGLKRCMHCDDSGGRRASLEKQPSVYTCHCGLTDLSAPIIVQNEYVGAFLVGQVILQHEGRDAVRKNMQRLVADLPVDMEKLGVLFDAVEEVQEYRVKAAADLMYIMTNYIVNIGVANLVQQQLLAEMKAKAELENLLQTTELKALQSQINPHFLFNTLNTIARLALLEGAEKTQQVVYALSDLLRNNLRDVDVLRTVEAEVKSIRDYLTIQEVRFGDRINSKIQLEPAVEDVLIPAMTLQPLVENAIVHGLENLVEGGTISLNGWLDEENDMVVLSVVDTGVGIAAELLPGLLHDAGRGGAPKPRSGGQTTGLGMINVHKRIQHFFGTQYGLLVQSTPGEGTAIFVRLPYRRQ